MSTIWCLTERRYLDQRMPADMVTWLRAQGHDVRVVVAEDASVRVEGWWVHSPWGAVADGDVVVSRARHPFALALLDIAGRRRARVVTPWASVAAVRNKARCADLLALHGLPVPETILAAGPEALAALGPDHYPLVVKPHLGDNGEGVVVLRGAADLSSLRWDGRLLLAQRWIDAGGWDVKVYVCGERVWAVRRRSPLEGTLLDVAEPLPVDPQLLWIARTCRDAFRLPLCGIDVIIGEHGPLVVDVNDFPNYTGVEEATEAVGAFVAARLGARERAEVSACAS